MPPPTRRLTDLAVLSLCAPGLMALLLAGVGVRLLRHAFSGAVSA